MDRLPEIGKFYDCYDDGKISESRRYQVKITNVIHFKDANEKIIEKWKKCVNKNNELFAKETDYFILADSYEQGKDNITKSIFARTLDKKDWFSFGLDCDSNLWNNGLLLQD